MSFFLFYFDVQVSGLSLTCVHTFPQDASQPTKLPQPLPIDHTSVGGDVHGSFHPAERWIYPGFHRHDGSGCSHGHQQMQREGPAGGWGGISLPTQGPVAVVDFLHHASTHKKVQTLENKSKSLKGISIEIKSHLDFPPPFLPIFSFISIIVIDGNTKLYLNCDTVSRH